MTIDHIAWLWLETATFEAQLLHFVGRLTAPIMCFLLVEGFFGTHHYTSYVRRLCVFALASQIPFTMMLEGIPEV